MPDHRTTHCHSRWLRLTLLLASFSAPLAQACTPPCDGSLDAWLPQSSLKTADQNVGDGSLLLPRDGKLLVVATCRVANSKSVCLSKFNIDGTLDPGFGSGGRVMLRDLPGALQGVLTVLVGDGNPFLPGASSPAALTPDGHIVIGATNDFHDWVVRLSSDGKTIDSIRQDPLASSILQAVLVQRDGKIVLLGNGYPGYADDITVARYQPDLSQADTSFGNGGASRLDAPAGASDTYLRAIIEAPDHSLVLAGQTVPAGATGSAGYVVKLTANGWYDGGFGTGGRWIDNYASGYIDLLANRQGEIWVAGTANTSPVDIRVLRMLPDASLLGARNYGANCSDGDDYASRIGIQPDGKILVTGHCDSAIGTETIELLRLTTTDNLDTSFGEFGYRLFIVVHSDSYKPNFADAIRVGGGGILLSWHSFLQDENPRWLSRFTLDEIFPGTFDN
ncbi:MAG TPA: hypothetical protein VFN09_09180 [Rhodanobacteraceae bacterium]|nr:hypothetical protein [Rhodanobacteraceae bacterium]